VERRAHAEFDAGQLEYVAPYMAGEYQITVADDGRRHAMKPDNVVEEGTGDGGGGVGVSQGDEVRVL
jgi:hypothetical protein